MIPLALVAWLSVLLCSALPNGRPESSSVPVREVPFGETVVLKCRSNDHQHNFWYWHFNKGNQVIGPSNEYDISKFKFEILSGNLTVRGVSQEEEGIYYCVSRSVKGDDINIKSVQVIVTQDWSEVYEHDSKINTIRILVALIVLVVLTGVGYFAYRIWKDRFRYPRYLAEEDEDDDSGEEIFRAPGPSGTSAKSTPPKSSKDSGSEFDNVDISTDFKSILDTANNK